MTNSTIKERANFFALFLILAAACLSAEMLKIALLPNADLYSLEAILKYIEITAVVICAYGVLKGYYKSGFLLGNIIIVAFSMLIISDIFIHGLSLVSLITISPIIIALYVLNFRLRGHFIRASIANELLETSEVEEESQRKVANS